MATHQPPPFAEIEELLRSETDGTERFSYRTGANRVIDLYREITDIGTRLELTTALDKIIADQTVKLKEVALDITLQATAIIGRACFAAVELKLQLNRTALSLIAFHEEPLVASGHVPANDLLLVLRAISRQSNGFGDVILWSKMLESSDKGIRTLAGQALVRMAPVKAIDNLSEIAIKDVNGALIAHSLLTSIGGRDQLVKHLESRNVAEDDLWQLQIWLQEAGETETSDLILTWLRLHDVIEQRLPELFADEDLDEMQGIYRRQPEAAYSFPTWGKAA